MGPGENDTLDTLIEDIWEDHYEPDNYNPDEFYEDAISFLSLYGYNRKEEVIWELDENDPVEVESHHLEVIAELEDKEDTLYLRFILEDGRPEREPPYIDQVDGPEDFDFQTDYQKQL